MNIDRTTVTNLANLSRLELDESEKKLFAQQLPKILDYVGQLQAVKTEIISEVNPAASGWRVDQIKPSSQADQIIDQAPEKAERFWRVPNVL